MAPVQFRGIGQTCECVARSLPVVEQWMIFEGLIVESIDLFQLGYRNTVAASAGTHAGGGCVDVAQCDEAQIDAWRMFGWTIQRRKLRGVKLHGHGWPLGCPHLSPAAQQQERDWHNRDAGLAGASRVAGRWPINRWDVALRRMETLMAKRLEDFKDDVVRDVITAVRAELRAELPRVWSADVIPNEFTGNEKNPTVQPRTAMGVLGERTRHLNATVDRQEKTLLAVLNEVRGGKAPTP